MTPMSRDPDARRRSIEALKANRSTRGLVPGAGAWKPGDSPHLVHGARTARPQRSADWSPATQMAILDLQDAVDIELKDQDGELHPWARPSVEAVALQKVACHRLDRYVADQEARGRVKPADLELQSRIAERYQRSLEREALTLRGRIEVMRTAADLALLMAQDADRERREADGA